MTFTIQLNTLNVLNICFFECVTTTKKFHKNLQSNDVNVFSKPCWIVLVASVSTLRFPLISVSSK